MLKPGDIILGKYRLLDELGAGAMGVVFAAVHLDTEKHVALKWLNPAISRLPSSAERFKLEAKATGRIHHPNVVAVHDSGEHEGQLFLAMEQLVGQTLRSRLAAAPGGRLQLEAALGILFPVLRGVAAAHAVGVLHRDLKPENIFLSESPDGLPPIPKVLDFGLAKLRSEASVASKLSMSGSVLGTFQYMAPEQLQPRGELDERADVYALGAILYELLTATCPYQADNPIDLLLQLQGLAPPPVNAHVPELSDAISNVIARALERDPARRYVSVEAFALALEPFSQQRFRGASVRDEARLPSVDVPSPSLPLSTTQRFDVRRGARAGGRVPQSRATGRPHVLQLGLAAGLMFLSPAVAGTLPARAGNTHESRSQDPAKPATLELLPAPTQAPPSLSEAKSEASSETDWAPASPPTAASAEPAHARLPVRPAVPQLRAAPPAHAAPPVIHIGIEAPTPSKPPPLTRRSNAMRRDEF